MVLPLEGHELVGPQQPHDLDLFIDASPPVGKIHAERLELHMVPADRHAEPEPAAAEHVESRRLLGHQRGLALRQDDDAGDELQPLGDGGEEGEQHERLVKPVGVLVGAPKVVRGGVAAEHVIEGEHMLVTQCLGRLPVVAHDCGIIADLGLWKNDAKLHSGPPSITVVRRRRGRCAACYHASSARHQPDIDGSAAQRAGKRRVRMAESDTWRGKVGGMSDEEVNEFLKEPHLCRLACLDEEGWPYIVPLWYQHRDGGFYVVPRARSVWAKHIQRDPRVHICIDVWESMRKVMAKGKAEIVEEPNTGGKWVEIATEMSLRYLGENGPKYLEPTLVEPRWLIFMTPDSQMTWQGVDWADRYKHAKW